MEKVKTGNLIRDFPGFSTNTDDLDLPDGKATIQTNLSCHNNGKLIARPGFQVVKFNEDEA